MYNKMIKKMLVVAIVMFFAVGNYDVFAQNEIGVDVSGDDNKMFNEDVIYPGWSKKKTVEVTNHSDTSAVDLYLNFKVKDGNTLADELKLYVIDSKGNYKIGGAGDKYTLKEADKKGSLFVETLETGENAIYQIKIKLDKDVGNEMQGKKTKIDIDFTIEGEATEGLTEAQILTNQRRAVTGIAPDDEKDDKKNKRISAMTSTNGIDGSDGSVAGVETCNSWPLWTWVLIIISFGVIVYLIGKGNENIADSKRGLLWQALALLGTLGLWYFFDTCRIYNWVPVVAGIGGTLLIMALFNKQNENKPSSN